MSINHARIGKMSAITFDVKPYRTDAILEHENLAAMGHYPRMADDLFNWIIQTEQDLGLRTYDDTKNQDDRATITLHTDTESGHNIHGNRITLRACEHVMFRLAHICLARMVGITKLLRSAFDEILAESSDEKVLASDPNDTP